MQRSFRPILTICVALGVTACGSGGATKPLAGSTLAPSSAAPSSAAPVDQAAATKAALKGYLKALDRAVKRRSPEPLLPYATEAWANKVIDQYQANLWSKKYTVIGSNTLASATPSVAGERATIEACVDSSNAFKVPVGTTRIVAGSGATAIGRWHDTAKLVLEAGRWKITGITSDGKQC